MQREIVVGWTTAKPRTTGKGARVVVEVEIRAQEQGLELSICGSVWQRDGRDIEMGGQCVDHLLPEIKSWAPGWNAERLARVVEVWRRWHLNGMRAGCEHQRQIDTQRTVQVGKEQKAIGWVYQREHPDGMLMRPCEVCGYKYGSSWLYEELPAEVVAEVESWS